MRFTASRMCCPGDESLVRVEHEDPKSDVDQEVTTSTTTNSANINTDHIVEPSSPVASASKLINSQDTTSPLKHPVQRPAKTYDQLEKEYIENEEALTDMDEAEWLKAIALLETGHTQHVLNQKEQRVLAIIDTYYESLREDQARKKASRYAERIAERKRAAIFADQIHR